MDFFSPPAQQRASQISRADIYLVWRNDAKAETPVLWPPHAKSQLIGKDSDTGRDWGQEEKGTTEDGMAGWHHWVDGREFEWTLGVGDGQGGLACCDSWGCKESDMTEKLNWTELKGIFHATMGTIKDRNGMDLTEAEDIKKMWQEYTVARRTIQKRSSWLR